MIEPHRLAIADTNLLVSAFILPASLPATALALLQRGYQVLLSPETHLELQAVVSRKKFDRYVPLEARLEVLNAFVQSASMVQPHIVVQACRHPKDDKFLSLAVSTNAALILTGDDDLRTLHPFRGIPILSPADFIASHSR